MGVVQCMMVSKALANAQSGDAHSPCEPIVMPHHTVFRPFMLSVPLDEQSSAPGKLQYCHASDINVWSIPVYTRPDALFNISYWPSTLTCDKLENDPWRTICQSSQWCDAREEVVDSKRPATDFRFAECEGVVSDPKFKLPSPQLKEITLEVRNAIAAAHEARFAKHLREDDPSTHVVINEHAVDECGFSPGILNIAMHIRRGDVSSWEREHSADINIFAGIANRIFTQLKHISPLPYRIVAFSEANVTGKFDDETTVASPLRKLYRFSGIEFERKSIKLSGGHKLYQARTTVFTHRGGKPSGLPTPFAPMYFRFNDDPWNTLQCLARADIFAGSASSFSTLGALLSRGVSMLPTHVKFVKGQCKWFGNFCKDGLVPIADFKKWNTSDFLQLNESLRADSGF